VTKPMFTVEVAFASDPFDDAPAWEDITPFVRSVDVTRGRQFELDLVEASVMTLELEDEDRRFDPTNAGSPHYPNVLPMRLVRFTVTHDAVTYRRFTGFIEAWPLRWEGGGDPGSSRFQLRCVDLFKVLAQKTLRSPYADVILADGPVRYFRFGDNGGLITDEAGSNPPHGAAFLAGGAVGGDADAAVADGNGAARFPGSPNYGVVLGPQPGLAEGSQLAVEFWVKFSTTATMEIVEVSDGFDIFVQCQAVLGQLVFNMRDKNDTGIGVTVASGTTYDDGQWHHFLGQYNTTNNLVALYVDNVLKGTAAPPLMRWRSANLVLGAISGGLSFFTGGLDELAFYDAPLSAAKRAAHLEARALRDGELSGSRINYILDRVGWPATPRAVDAGNSALAPATALEGRSALEALQAVAAAEGGVFFISGDGTPTFLERRKRSVPPRNVPQATFGDGEDEVDYELVELVLDDQRIINEVRLSSPNLFAATVRDAASEATYGPRTLEQSLDLNDGDELIDRANFELSRYRDARVRCEAVEFGPVYDDASWTALLSRELSDRVLVRRRPPTGPAIEREAFIEQTSDAVAGDELRLGFQLSPAEVFDFWILGDAERSKLGQTTRLGY
jgi:hypothetical protein